eukprot:482825-Prorocentrum_minimum.AAC.2
MAATGLGPGLRESRLCANQTIEEGRQSLLDPQAITASQVYTAEEIVEMVASTHDGQVSIWHMFSCYALLNVTFVLIAASTVLFLGPVAAGSGISDVKVLGITFAVAGSLAVGHSGPLVCIGACIASAFGAHLPLASALGTCAARVSQIGITISNQAGRVRRNVTEYNPKYNPKHKRPISPERAHPRSRRQRHRSPMVEAVEGDAAFPVRTLDRAGVTDV